MTYRTNAEAFEENSLSKHFIYLLMGGEGFLELGNEDRLLGCPWSSPLFLANWVCFPFSYFRI